jgi:hypothetical protein
MESKKINKILLFVSIVLIVAFIGCLAYSLYNPKFSFIETISSISSFFIACLTVIYVYTTSNQMDLMKQQLKQMQQEQQLSEQPILDLESTKFEIERPRFYYTPPMDEYSYLSRYLFFVQINNISNYPAVFVDVNAQLIIEENGHEMYLDATSRRVNAVAANSASEPIDIMFAGDGKNKIMSALRSFSTSGLPKLRISICYKSLSGANYMLAHTYWLDIANDNEEYSKILKNWHTTLVSAPVEEKEVLDVLKKTPKGKERNRVFDLSKELFDKKLEGDKVLPINMIEIPQNFSLKAISDDEFNNEIKHHQYGHYVGKHAGECMSEEQREETTVGKV